MIFYQLIDYQSQRVQLLFFAHCSIDPAARQRKKFQNSEIPKIQFIVSSAAQQTMGHFGARLGTNEKCGIFLITYPKVAIVKGYKISVKQNAPYTHVKKNEKMGHSAWSINGLAHKKKRL